MGSIYHVIAVVDTREPVARRTGRGRLDVHAVVGRLVAAALNDDRCSSGNTVNQRAHLDILAGDSGRIVSLHATAQLEGERSIHGGIVAVVILHRSLEVGLDAKVVVARALDRAHIPVLIAAGATGVNVGGVLRLRRIIKGLSHGGPGLGSLTTDDVAAVVLLGKLHVGVGNLVKVQALTTDIVEVGLRSALNIADGGRVPADVLVERADGLESTQVDRRIAPVDGATIVYQQQEALRGLVLHAVVAGTIDLSQCRQRHQGHKG